MTKNEVKYLNQICDQSAENRDLKAKVSEQRAEIRRLDQVLDSWKTQLRVERESNAALRADFRALEEINADLKACLAEACDALRLCCDKIESLEAHVEIVDRARDMSFN